MGHAIRSAWIPFLTPKAPNLKLHAFVAMPFGTKPDAAGNPVDFNAVYDDLIRPALEKAGLDVFRADEEPRAGDIRADMFQELLMADLVLADLSIDNPNVWYELGVRHALRARGVILLQAPRDRQPFDIYTDRKLHYRLKDGRPDPATLDDDRKAITDMATATLKAWHGRKVSPVYALLPNLQEPDWKSLRIGDAREFWERHDAWCALIERARDDNRPEDILVLADEAPITALRVEARLAAGNALLQGRHFNFALEQFDLAHRFDPDNLTVSRKRGVCLQRIGRAAEAQDLYRDILAAHPDDVETWSLLGRVDKDAWVTAWRTPGSTPEAMRDAATYEDALLRAAIDSYAAAFRAVPGHFYSGINAVTLMALYQDLTGDTRYAADQAVMAGGIAWSAHSTLTARPYDQAPQDLYWAAATLGDLAVLRGDAPAVRAAYKEAIVHADNDWFALDSTLGQLRLLAELGFRPDNVAAGIATYERALARLRPPEKSWQPGKVFLFSGHMVDAPGRKEPRFPADKEPVAAAAIDQALSDEGASDQDLALTQGAAGGDLLFAEAALKRGLRLQLLLPLPEPDFIEASILRSADGETWRKRYFQVRDHALCLPPRVMPDVLGPLPVDHLGNSMNEFERCNQWLLYSALACGIARTRFVCLWNGTGGDGPGGTQHMVQEVRRRTGKVTWLDTRKLW